MNCNCCNCCEQEQDETLVGTVKKYKVEIEGEGFDMEEDDFTVEIRRSGQSIVLHKEDMIHNSDGFYIAFDTGAMGAGRYEAITRAYVPDDDFEGDVRPEIDKQTLTIAKNV